MLDHAPDSNQSLADWRIGLTIGPGGFAEEEAFAVFGDAPIAVFFIYVGNVRTGQWTFPTIDVDGQPTPALQAIVRVQDATGKYWNWFFYAETVAELLFEIGSLYGRIASIAAKPLPPVEPKISSLSLIDPRQQKANTT